MNRLGVPDNAVFGVVFRTSRMASAIKTYLQTFEKNLAASKTGAELITSLQKAYPDAGLGVALDIGAKVNKGEMKW